METVRTSTVVIDAENNRLNITLTGAVSKEEVDKIMADVQVLVPELKPGFNVVNDLTQCKLGHLSGLSSFKHIIEYLMENKVGKVVRIVGKAKVIFNQISRFTEHIQGYDVVYVSTLEEADDILRKSP